MVQAPLEMRIDRVMKRDGLSRAEVEGRNAHQFSEEKKSQMANYIIKNDESQLVIPQILNLDSHFRSLGGSIGQ